MSVTINSLDALVSEQKDLKKRSFPKMVQNHAEMIGFGIQTVCESI
ncbi:MAG: hypothetical protein JXR11_12930 [Balneola sp.]